MRYQQITWATNYINFEQIQALGLVVYSSTRQLSITTFTVSIQYRHYILKQKGSYETPENTITISRDVSHDIALSINILCPYSPALALVIIPYQ